MCFYRYYYFSGCGHQKTVLFAYCDNAEEVAPAGVTTGRPEEQSPLQGKETEQETPEQRGRTKRHEKEHLRSHEDLPSLPSSVRNLQQQYIITTELGSAFIKEPLLETSSRTSLPSEQYTSHSPEQTDTMAGLASFGGILRSRVSDRASKESHTSSSWQSVSSFNDMVSSEYISWRFPESSR